MQPLLDLPLLNMPLQRKIGLFVLAGLLFLFALFGLLGVLLADESARRITAERLVITQLTGSFLDSRIDEQYQHLERAAAFVADAPGDHAGQQHFVRDLVLQSEPFVTGVFLADRIGRILVAAPDGAAGIGADLATGPYLRESLATGARYASIVHARVPDGRPAVVLAVPVRARDGTPMGVLAAMVDPAHPSLNQFIAAARQLGQTGHAELIDQQGRVIASSEPGRALGPGEHPDFYRPLFERRSSGVGATGPIGDEDPAERGQRHVMAFVPLVSAPWGLSLGGSKAELSAVADRWRWQTTLLGGLSLVIALFLVWVTTRSVVRPVRVLTAISQRIAAGDLATPVPHVGEGEVRTLVEAFDDMRRHLQQALAALAMETSRSQGIVASMADAVYTTDARFCITAFNPAAEALTGWRAADVLGRPCVEVVRPVDGCGQAVCPTACPLPPGAMALAPVVTKETIHRRDGRAVVVATTRSTIRDHDGAPAGVVHVLRDVSAEEELSRLKDEFLSTVSHELRSPLGAIKGYATTLLLPDGLRDAETTLRCLRIVVEASDELQELVDNLLDMSKISAGVFEVVTQPIRVARLAHAAAERVRSRSHRLRVAVPANLPAVSADPHRIEQVLYNLLDNAIKYSPDGGRISIAAEVAGDQIVVGVADEGLGIPPEELGGLFEHFHRGKTARTRQIGGSGLGLAICKGIVEAHGGRIWAESPAPGRAEHAAPGTLVRFTLPIAAGPCRPARRIRTQPRAASGALPAPAPGVEQ